MSSKADRIYARSTIDIAHAIVRDGPFLAHRLIVPLKPRILFTALCCKISIFVGVLKVSERHVGCGLERACK